GCAGALWRWGGGWVAEGGGEEDGAPVRAPSLETGLEEAGLNRWEGGDRLRDRFAGTHGDLEAEEGGAGAAGGAGPAPGGRGGGGGVGGAGGGGRGDGDAGAGWGGGEARAVLVGRRAVVVAEHCVPTRTMILTLRVIGVRSWARVPWVRNRTLPSFWNLKRPSLRPLAKDCFFVQKLTVCLPIGIQCVES